MVMEVIECDGDNVKTMKTSCTALINLTRLFPAHTRAAVSIRALQQLRKRISYMYFLGVCIPVRICMHTGIFVPF